MTPVELILAGIYVPSLIGMLVLFITAPELSHGNVVNLDEYRKLHRATQGSGCILASPVRGVAPSRPGALLLAPRVSNFDDGGEAA